MSARTRGLLAVIALGIMVGAAPTAWADERPR